MHLLRLKDYFQGAHNDDAHHCAMIRATLSIPSSPELLQLFRTEQESFKHKRASYTLVEGKELTIKIEAEDGSALKATVASICRVVTIYEKAKTVRA